MTFEQWFYSLPLRLRSFFRRQQVDLELEDELRDHLEQQIKENVAAGMTPEDARYSALRAMGGMTQSAQQCRARPRTVVRSASSRPWRAAPRRARPPAASLRPRSPWFAC